MKFYLFHKNHIPDTAVSHFKSRPNVKLVSLRRIKCHETDKDVRSDLLLWKTMTKMFCKFLIYTFKFYIINLIYIFIIICRLFI